MLVTGAAGFVGQWLCRVLQEQGHTVLAGVREPVPGLVGTQVFLDLDAPRTLQRALESAPSAIIHLAAVSSGVEARRDPERCWTVNVLGTIRLLLAVEQVTPSARFLCASTGEVYGAGLERPATERTPLAPTSPYAASKAAAELGVMEAHRRAGLDVVIARPFAQAGPGQRDGFVVPALARRVVEAVRRGRREIPVGNLEPTREFLDVRDVATALTTLLHAGEAGRTYNVAAQRGVSLRHLLELITTAAGWDGTAVPDAALMRKADIPYLVGDGSALMALGWSPRFTLEETVRDVVRQWEPESQAKERAEWRGRRSR